MSAVTTFRAAFFPVWWLTTAWSGILAGGVLCGFAAVWRMPIDARQILVTIFCAVITGSLLTVVIACYRLHLNADGIRSYDAYGIYHLARWDAIESVRPFNLCGLRYLRVRTAGTRRQIWIPLFLSDLPGFREALSRLAGPDHPLLKSLPQSARPST